MTKAHHKELPRETKLGDSGYRTVSERFASIRLLLIPILAGALVCGLAWFQTKTDRRLSNQYLQPGLVFYRQHDYIDAERCFRAYLRGGTDTEVHYYLGMCLYNEGRRSEAVREFLQDTYDDTGRLARHTHIRRRSEIMIDQIAGR